MRNVLLVCVAGAVMIGLAGPALAAAEPVNLCDDGPPICPRGPYQAFFGPASDTIDAAAAQLLDAVVADHARCPTMTVWIGGFTDRAGTVADNLGLAERRAQAAANYLMAHGIMQARITTAALGFSDPQVPSADGVREPLNNRVRIEFDRPVEPKPGS